MLDRRRLLASGGAAALAGTLPACATTPAGSAAAPPAAGPAGARLTALLDRLVAESLQRSPRQATSLGLDVSERAELRRRLEDRSPEAEARSQAQTAQALADLRAIGRSGLTAAEQVIWDTVDFQLTTRQQLDRFPYGRGANQPYVVSQRSGAYQSVPDFLGSQHPVQTAADAEAYVARVDAFATLIEQETERFRSEAAAGALPPSFILDTTTTQLKALRDQPPADTDLVRALARKAAERGLAETYAKQAADLFATKVVPALDRQIAAVGTLRSGATADAGVWKLPQGEAYYAAALRNYTTTDLGAEEIHRIGREQVAELTARLDAALKGEGYTQGTVLQRLQAINTAPDQVWPNTEEGRAGLLKSLNDQIAAFDPLLPQVFGRLPRAKVEVRRVPVAIQDGAANGYYQRPTLDGSRPGAFYINLKDTTEWPKWSLPTLTYHEASPGHHLQNAIALETESLPLYMRAFTGFSAYGEGWALYAEQVADELGAYRDYPLGRVGLHQSYLFRAARLVVDTGLHHKRWTREQANAYMNATTGDPPGQTAREIDRYIENPGQACSYKLGQTVMLRLREEARRRQGARFDIKRFHDVVLESGRVPLTVLERVVTARLT